MPNWLYWILLGIATAGAILSMLLGNVLRSKNEQRFRDKYDPVRLQREESMYTHVEPPRKE